ncbi:MULTISPECIES: Veg family protein [Aerococcus]|uniref:Veg protein n=1 Tax=Aerococcus sanguinicola TaxID=119206 RepID=A0A5N1GPJ6_9LACT|nr:MULTISPECIES: Veg family protein [Aerococcus]KAA9302314.1 hypothetical protein F6I03_03610 [Aerococcus sanguinicola]MDK6369068.1 Veg family protein [Aerococcus sp. UMB9870]MDK6678970.1 Veg family protein [Aerococcus sp. UMB8608]MDK6686561.1 Veg family protein [Aerococcus sp. UMB8623]MDK6939629.1 Veg family protein [Aerococcus sp. UMB8487]
MSGNLAAIKAALDEKLGRRIQVTQQTGRKRITVRQGILSDTFPAVFVVELDQDQNQFERVCYSYTDVLTESVEIEFNN